MLNFLRAKQHNVFVKIFLGVIGFLLVGFFGVRNSNKFAHNAEQLADVNGVPILSRFVEYKLEQKLDELKARYNMQEFPPNLLDSLRQNTLENVIQIELLHQNLASLGIKTPDTELSDAIKNTILQDGVFDSNFYLNEFLPGFEAQTGHSFEEEFRAQLAAEKVFNQFEGLFQLSDEEALKIYNWQNTKFRYVVVKIPKFKKKEAPAPETTPPEAETASTDEPDPDAVVHATQLFDQWSKGGDLAKLLKPLNLNQKITPDLNPIQIERVFDGDAAFEDVAAIAKLTAQKPFPDKPFEKEKFFYLVKLDAKTAAPANPDAKALEAIKTNFENEMTNTLESKWLDGLQNGAKITRSPQN